MNKEEILEIIKDGSVDISKLKILLSDMNTVDIAEIFDSSGQVFPNATYWIL